MRTSTLTETCYSYSFLFVGVAVDLFDELVELCAVPVVLNVGAWLAEVHVEQLSEGHAHRSLGRPRHRLQQQRNDRPLYRVRQTHLAPVNVPALQRYLL